MKRQIVAIIGSTKFKEDFHKVQSELVMGGNIVLTKSVFHHADDIELTPEQFDNLVAISKDQIDMATRVMVINTGGYIGETTKEEIAYAESLRLPVDYMVPQE